MDRTLLFVSGMFRSGTTMLGRMLNAHPQVAVASDPFLPFFKHYRSDVAAQQGLKVSTTEALADYYFSPSGIRLFEAIQSASFDMSFDPQRLGLLRQQIRAYGEPYSPKIMPYLDCIRGASYHELLVSMTDLVATHYAAPGATVVGFKEVWTDEFIPAMARRLPEAKFIEIVRDVRAVCASKKSASTRYPWLFLCRQWRKLAALAWHYGAKADFSRQVLVLRYEDLVTGPQQTAQRICEFLDVPFCDVMVDPSRYVDGAGKPWVQNSSYGGGGQGFSTKGLTKWQQVLSDDEVALIETICGPEMKLHDYELQSPRVEVADHLLFNPPTVPKDELAQWTRDMDVSDVVAATMALGLETMRLKLLLVDAGLARGVDAAVIRNCFLLDEVFSAARAAVAVN